MERIVRFQVESQPEGTCAAAGTDTPGIVARGRSVRDTPQSAEIIARDLIANAGFAFDPLPAWA